MKRLIPHVGRWGRGVTGEVQQRVALTVVLGLGIALRIDALQRPDTIGDAAGYVYRASLFSWLDPWEASYREPLWTAFVKAATGPFGYTPDAMRVTSVVLSVAGLLVAVWALRVTVRQPWIVVAATATLALTGRLVDDAAFGGRESLTLGVVSLAVGLAAVRPNWLPALGAVMLAVRWELGVCILVMCVALCLCRAVTPKCVLGGAGLAMVLIGPFLVNNAREVGDPMFHSNIHATFNRNVELDRPPHGPPIPEPDRLFPDLAAPLYAGPLVSWADYVDLIGAEELVRREAEAFVRLPAEALTFGVFPLGVGAVLLVTVVVGSVVRPDQVVLAAWLLMAASIAGYGMILPALDDRLASSVTVLMVVLLALTLDRFDEAEQTTAAALAVSR